MKKGRFTTVILILIFIAGLALLLYPIVADYWNSLHASRTIAAYSEEVKAISPEETGQYWRDAEAYNEEIFMSGNPYRLSDDMKKRYEELLNVSGSGVMGYVEIKKINVSLPVYHGISDGVLQVAAGHLEWTSLPVGGINTHTVLSGHRGLPSAKLFSELNELKEGDTFTLVVLNAVLTYEVDQIRIVEPDETEDLKIVPGYDYCTLVTCTPYGINTHRLCVRGHRIETESESRVQVVSEAIVIDPMIIAPIVAMPILLVLFIMVLVRK